MGFVSINRYIETLSNPRGLLRTLSGFEVERDCYGRAVLYAGNSSAVFPLRRPDGGRFMLKCYLRDKPFLRPVYDYAAASGSRLIRGVRLLPDEMFVYDSEGGGSYRDVVVGEWIEGESLAAAVSRCAAAGDRVALAGLAGRFDLLAAELLAAEFAHGDLKPDNIIVSPDGELRPVDFDALYVPTLAGCRAAEVGTPKYNHPLRDETFYNDRVDDYPAAVISLSIHALAFDPGLLERYCTGDNLIFDPQEIMAGTSRALDEAEEMIRRSGDMDLLRLCSAVRSPSPAIEGIGELFGRMTSGRGSSTSDASGLEPFVTGGKWGFRRADGTVVVEPLFDDVLDFSCGVAAVRAGEVWHYIDPSGRTVINCSGYEAVKSFGEGLAAVRRDGAWGFIDLGGTEVIAPRFRRAGTFSAGAAAVETAEEKFAVDRCGNRVRR